MGNAATQNPVIDLSIQNIYPDEVVTTTVTGLTVPAPDDYDTETLDAWAQQHLFEHTGTGRTDGESGYDITITASTDSRLLRRTFEFG